MRGRVVGAQLGALAILASAILACAGGGSRSPDASREAKRDEKALDRLRSPPLGLPPVHLPADNPASVEKIALGRRLFFDRRLSVNDTMSCAMCHIPEQGFTNNELSTPVGVHGRSGRRNAPTILNAAYAVHVFLDGRKASLEAQAVAPLFDHNEMANPSAAGLIAKLERLPGYAARFERAFGGGPTLERIGMAIATWERTMLAGASPFDRWRHAGEEDALTAPEKRGFELFVGKARCVKCHRVEDEYALFTDHEFHDTGVGYLHDRVSREAETAVPVEIAPGIVVTIEREVVRKVGEPPPIDRGRFEVTREAADMWRFRTPGLRNVALTAPYMHDGSLSTLEEVVRFYDRGGVPHSGLDPAIEALGLDEGEIAALAAFLRSLTGGNLAALQADARSVAVGN